MAPGGNNIQEGGNSNSGAVAAGVIVCLLVLGAAATVTIVLVVLLLRRRQGQHKFDSSSNGIDNQHYERQVQTSGSINGKSINLLPVRDDTKDSVGGTGDTTHDYAAIPADDAYYEDMNVRLIHYSHQRWVCYMYLQYNYVALAIDDLMVHIFFHFREIRI